ncbi:MAG: hypothetical protein J5792_07895 [Bacteroidales bacterium]|nr:hypothetical protein [Bacteroidales bacterium]
MFDNNDDFFDYFGTIVGGIVLIMGLVFLFTIIFGDNSCSKPKKQELEYGCVECDVCGGTGYVSSQEIKIGWLGDGYVNQKCSKCNGTGMYRVIEY